MLDAFRQQARDDNGLGIGDGSFAAVYRSVVALLRDPIMPVSVAEDALYLQSLLHAAPFDDGGWARALDALAHRTGSRRAQLLGVGDARAVRFNYVSDPLENLAAYQREFIEIGGHRPDVNWRIAASAEPLKLVWEKDYDAVRKHVRNEAYDAHASRWDGDHGCQTALLTGPDLLMGLAVLRGRREGRTTARDRRLFEAVSPHVLSAVRLQHALDHRGAQLAAGALSSMDAAALLCDGGGIVRALTPQAETIVSTGVPLRLKQGRLSAARPDHVQHFRQAMQAVLTGDTQEALAQRIWLEDGGAAGDGMLCELFRLQSPDWDFGFAPRLLVILRRPADMGEPRRLLLKSVLHLTDAEAAVALAIANGASREEVAMARGASVQTVGAQLKSIFRKSEVEREASLVALVNRLLR